MRLLGKKNNNNRKVQLRFRFFYLSYLSSIQMNEGAPARVLEVAITFECQKIILAVIFSNIRAAAKARNGHGGERK